MLFIFIIARKRQNKNYNKKILLQNKNHYKKTTKTQ